MVLRRVSILLTLFIFGMIVHAWCDSVKSINGAAIQLTAVKVDENRAALQKKTERAKESAEWFKKTQAKPRDVNFLRALEEKKRSQWVESLNNIFCSREFLENVWRNKFLSPPQPQRRETKSSSSDSGQSILKPYPDEDSYPEEGRILTALKLHQPREEILKEIFMGFRFSFDLTHGHMLLEMNVTPSSEKRSGLTIRF
jgi:hypothetical protein